MGAVDLRLSECDPSQIVTVAEACELLGISRSTLYRLTALQRVRVSAGRVGYRAGDLLEHSRRGLGTPAFGHITNCVVDDTGGTLSPDWFLELPGPVSKLIRRSHHKTGAPVPLTLELPPAYAWFQAGHRELEVIDYDGGNSTEPTVIVAAEGERIGARERLIVTEPGVLVRLVPLCGCPEKIPGGWWVA